MKRLFLKNAMLILSFLMSMNLTNAQNDINLIKANSRGIVYTGRFNFNKPESPAFSYPGTQIEANFNGTSLGVYMKPNSGYYMVTIDYNKPFKIHVSRNDSIVTLAENLKEGTHYVKLMLVSEAYQARPEFRGFILDEGQQLAKAPKVSKRTIEFIGDSMTCGYGVEADSPSVRFSDANSNFYYSCPAIATRALGARSMVVARSGIGIYRNYAGPVTGSKVDMPYTYGYTLYNDDSQNWDFSRFTPKVVCVNLGTNDTSTSPYDTTLIRDSYRDFLKDLRSYYPKAKIVLITGIMLDGQSLKDMQDALDQVVLEANRAGDKKVYRLNLEPAKGDLGYGSDYHPSIAQNQKTSIELIMFLQKITGWGLVGN